MDNSVGYSIVSEYVLNCLHCEYVCRIIVDHQMKLAQDYASLLRIVLNCAVHGRQCKDKSIKFSAHYCPFFMTLGKEP